LPQTTYTVTALQAPLTYFVYWAVYVVGCDLDAAIIFDRDLIETYVREALPKSMADGTLRNYRAWITRVAEAINPKMNPRQPMPLNDRSMGAPYTAEENVALERWATGQPTTYRRMQASTLIALAAGAGLTSSEIARLTRADVTVRESGLVELEVPTGEKTRRVIVASRYEKVISTQIRDLSNDSFVFLPKRATADGDVISAFVGRTVRPAGTPQVTVRRLRNTWFVTQLTNRVDVLTLMEAAGLQSLETISKLAIYVPRPDADDRDAQLRGAL
jgi:integrase